MRIDQGPRPSLIGMGCPGTHRTVQVNCVERWMSGSVQVKAKNVLLLSIKVLENLSLRFKTEKWEIPEGIVESSV